MDELLRHIKEEWSQLVKAPGAFAILFLLAFIAAFTVIEWAHSAKMSGLEQEVSTVKSTNELLKDRIDGKDEQLTDYRSKNLELQTKLAALVPTIPPKQGAGHPQVRKEQFRQSATRFSNASNRELTTFATTLATEIRQLAQNASAAITANPRDIGAFQSGMAVYDRNYQADAIVLRDEMMSRLPLIKRDTWTDSMYNQPTNPIGLNEVARDLDRLGKMLPTK